MKIIRINNQNLSFTAGKVNLYSDFDGTYFPESQSALYDIKPEKVNELNNGFKSFNTFFENTEGDISFKITTGRSFGEFRNISNVIKSKGINMPYPKTFISKNGSDEFIRTSDFGFYSQEFPYKYDFINSEKEDDIRLLTNWTEEIKPKLKEILSEFDFEIIEHDSEHSVKDHGESSLFAKLGYDNFELTENMEPKSDWKVGLRRDGNLKLSISFPYDMLHAKGRKSAYNKIKSKFEHFLNEKNVKFAYEEFIFKDAGNRPTLEYYPKIDGESLSKLYDTKKAVKQAIQNNDLVITAGDGLNDLDMLNPLNYIEGEKNLSNPETIKELKRLPFIGIVVKSENSGLEGLYQKFGEFGKIIEIEKGHLQEGIIAAIKDYAQKSKEFAQNMSENLKFELDIPSDTIKQPIKQPKSGNGKLLAITGGLTAGIAGIIFALQNQKSNEVRK